MTLCIANEGGWITMYPLLVFFELNRFMWSYVDFSAIDHSHLSIDALQRTYSIPITVIKAETVSFAANSKERLIALYNGMKYVHFSSVP